MMTLNNIEKVMCECMAVTPMYVATASQIPDALEVTVSTISQPFSWDTRKKTSSTTVAIMEVDDSVPNDAATVATRFKMGPTLGTFAITREMLNAQFWNVEVKSITGLPVLPGGDWFVVFNFTW